MNIEKRLYLMRFSHTELITQSFSLRKFQINIGYLIGTEFIKIEIRLKHLVIYSEILKEIKLKKV
jgi:hypothetical protein